MGLTILINSDRSRYQVVFIEKEF